MTKKPIIVAGFGRSGTTWVSDIISKSLGGVLLFEPCHPLVCPNAVELAYRSSLDAGDKNNFHSFLLSLLAGENQDPWLLRNHLGDDPLTFNADYIREIWSHTNIIGYKTIRWNHLLSTQVQLLNAELVYIVRHPLAVVSSLMRRVRFWDEFGWAVHRRAMSKEILDHPNWSSDLQRVITRLRSSGLSRVQYTALFWALSQAIVLLQLRELNVEPLLYEKLYAQPFDTVKQLLASIGCNDVPLHPSYIFTPSMQTLKTVHQVTQLTETTFPHFFWKDLLSQEEIADIYMVINPIIEKEALLSSLFDEANYHEPVVEVSD